MGAEYGTGHAPGMARDGATDPVVCGIGGGYAGRRVAAFAGGLAGALAAPLIAVRVEAPPDSVGDPATALTTVAAEMRAQMLVVGTEDSPALVGGVSREVAIRASCPVLVLPRTRPESRERAWQRRHILCAFDGAHHSRATLGVAAAVAEQLGTAAFVAHMRPGCVDDLRAHAQAGRAAMVVASSRAVQDWGSKRRKSTHDGWAPIGRIPLLLVPPACEMGTARRRAGGAHPMELSGPSVR